MKKGLLFFLTALLSVALFVAGCSQSGGSGENGEEASGEGSVDSSTGEKVISIGQDYDLSNLDPALITTVTDGQMAINIFDSLMLFDPEKGEIVEGLAESYEVSDDGLTYTFKLREGVQFHKGYGEMTSEDVKFTLERIIDPETNAKNRSFLLTIDEINTPDDYTVEIKLNENDPMLIENLSQYWTGIVSKKAVEEKGEDFNSDPIGTGPFMFDSWEPQTATTLVKNEDWYRDEVKLDKVRFVPIPEPSTLYLSFESGDLDIIQVSDPERLEQYENDDRFYIEREPGYIVRHIGFNTEKEPFDDVRVRKALTYGFDRQTLLDEVLTGLSIPAHGTIPPNVTGYEEEVAKYPYDPEKAKELLAEAGYADGLSFTFPVPNMDRFMTPATVFQADMEKIGVDVEIEVVEATTYLEEAREGKYPLFVLSNSQTGVPDFILNRIYNSENAGGGDNYTQYKNDDVDAWLDELGNTLDEEKRQEILSNIQKQLAEDVPYIWIDHEEHIFAVNNRVEGYHVTPTRSLQVYTVDVKE